MCHVFILHVAAEMASLEEEEDLLKECVEKVGEELGRQVVAVHGSLGPDVPRASFIFGRNGEAFARHS